MVDRTDPAIVQLLNLSNSAFGRPAGPGRTDNELTRGEVRRFISQDTFNTNRNDVIDPAEIAAGTVLQQMTTIDLATVTGLTPEEMTRLRKAQELLRSVVTERLVPPNPIRGTPNEFAPLIIDPYEISEDSANRWSRMRVGSAGGGGRPPTQINITAILNRIRAGAGNVSALVADLWSSEDYIDGVRTKVFRMEELVAVFKYIQELRATNPGAADAFQQSFFREMGLYLNRADSGLDPQFVLDSFLHLIQSTNFDAGIGGEDMKNFLKGVVKGILDNATFFAGKTGIVGNYDGTRDGGIFGSLAVQRNPDGSIVFLEHDPSDPTKRTTYQIVEGPVAAGGASLTDNQLFNQLNEIKVVLNDPANLRNLLAAVPDQNSYDVAKAALDAYADLPSISAVMNNPIALNTLKGHLQTLLNLANGRNENLANRIRTLIGQLESYIRTIPTPPPAR